MLTVSTLGAACSESATAAISQFGGIVDGCLGNLWHGVNVPPCHGVEFQLNVFDKTQLLLCPDERRNLLTIAGRILVAWRGLAQSGGSQTAVANQQIAARLAAVRLVRHLADASRLTAIAALVQAGRIEDSEFVLIEIIAGLRENVTQSTPINFRNDAVVVLDTLRAREDLSKGVRQLAETTFQKLKPLIGTPTFPEPEPPPVGPPLDVKDKERPPSRILPIALAVGAASAFGLVLWLALRSRPQRPTLLQGYYTVDPHAPMSIVEVAKRWAKQGDKAYDAPKPYVFWYPIDEVLPYREYICRRGGARLDPAEWDALRNDMAKAGWTTGSEFREKYLGQIDPAHIIVGRNGYVKVGEGNHRLAIARELGIKIVPVQFHFYENVEPFPQSPEARAHKIPLDGWRRNRSHLQTTTVVR